MKKLKTCPPHTKLPTRLLILCTYTYYKNYSIKLQFWNNFNSKQKEVDKSHVWNSNQYRVIQRVLADSYRQNKQKSLLNNDRKSTPTEISTAKE